LHNALLPLPDLNPPKVASASGLGAGGGAGALGDSSANFTVLLHVGKAPASSGSVVLSFASLPATLFFGAEERLGTLSVSGQGTMSVTVSWTGAKLIEGETIRIFGAHDNG